MGPNSDIPVPAYIGAVNSATQISLSSSPTANIPVAAKAGDSAIALEIESVSGATPVGCTLSTSCASTLLPQAYNNPNTGANATYNNEVPNNAFGGGAGGRILTNGGTSTAAGATTTVGDSAFVSTDVGRPISGVGVGLGGVVTAVNSRTQTGVTWATGSTTLNGAFVATDVGQAVTGGTGLPAGSIIQSVVAGTSATIQSATTAAQATAVTVTITSATVSVASTASGTGVTLTLGGTSWWQPTGASGNTGTLVLGVVFPTPRSVSSVVAHWLDASKCPGHGTCDGFEPTAYTIATSTNGSTFSTCATVTTNTVFTTTDACSASGVSYLEFVITSWHATTPYDGYGPALNSLIIS
jgi:hypothetical protein